MRAGHICDFWGRTWATRVRLAPGRFKPRVRKMCETKSSAALPRRRLSRRAFTPYCGHGQIRKTRAQSRPARGASARRAPRRAAEPGADREAAGLRRSAAAPFEAVEAHPRGMTGATATIESLKSLLELGDPNLRDRPPWTPHRPERPEKSEGGRRFKIVSRIRAQGRPARGDPPARRGRQRSTSATRCCSASPARARPSRWPKSSRRRSARR